MAHSGFSLSTTGEPVIASTPSGDLSPRFQVNSERFTTSGLDDPDRVEKWEDHNAKALVSLGARTIHGASLEATEVNLHLPRLHFAHVAANAHVIERSSAHIRSAPADSVVLYFALFGDSFFYHKDGVRTLGPGSVLVYDSDRPFMRGFAKGLKELVLMVPRNSFAEISDGELPASGEPHVLNFGKSTKANDFATLIADNMSKALSNPADEPLTETEDHIFDLLRGIFASTSASSLSSQFRIALAFIDRHLRNPDLSASMISLAIGVSERQLSRVFSSQNRGIVNVVLDKRLDLARRLLMSTTRDQMTVNDVSQHCGFNSHAHFSRVFRNRFGLTPSEARTGPSVGTRSP